MYTVRWICEECNTSNKQEVEGTEEEKKNLELKCEKCEHIAPHEQYLWVAEDLTMWRFLKEEFVRITIENGSEDGA